MAPSCLWTGTLSVTGQVWRTNLQERSASSSLANLRRLVFPRYQEVHAPPQNSAPALSSSTEPSSTPPPFQPDNIEFPINLCCWQGKRADSWWLNGPMVPVESEGPHSNGSTVECYRTNCVIPNPACLILNHLPKWKWADETRLFKSLRGFDRMRSLFSQRVWPRQVVILEELFKSGLEK